MNREKSLTVEEINALSIEAICAFFGLEDEPILVTDADILEVEV